MYIKRLIDSKLVNWKEAKVHKPILLRGARQIGKSSSVREFGKLFDNFVEINFEKKEHTQTKTVFGRSSSPQKIIEELEAIYGQPIRVGKTLLFLDEIQACMPAIESLRYFYEEMPELHVIAAGSLLEFALQEIPTFGVGRITSIFMYPLCFTEYLGAMGFDAMVNKIAAATPDHPLSEAIHSNAINHLVRFISIGGMPEVVKTYIEENDLLRCQQVLDDLMDTYYNDFSKYKKRVPPTRLRDVFSSVMEQCCKKFTYSNASTEASIDQIKDSLMLLEMAGLIHSIYQSTANGIPIGAQINRKFTKYIPFDTGIFQRFLGLNIGEILIGQTLEQINKGDIAELFVGLEMLKAMPTNRHSQLYYWQRGKNGSHAQVDYVFQKGNTIVPVEVKSGTTGKMQSLHLFMREKESEYGIRTSLENFSQYDKIKVYPLYAVSNFRTDNSL
ncbi:ATPase [Bacteroidia bacterium]|nr:ATPase [Bacteroidia bacterium]